VTRARWVVVAVVAAGCPKTPPEPAFVGVSPALMRLAPPPQVVEYDRHTVAGPFGLPDLRHREEWGAPTPTGHDLVWDVATWDVTDDGRDLIETVRVFYGPDGYGFLGTVVDGALEPWEPRQVVLPPDPHVGDTWTATHTKGGRTGERTCEIMATDHCIGGVVSVCESKKPDGVVVLRDHFCPGDGWVGFEALQMVGSNPPVRMWSEEVTRDGRALLPLPVEEE
jgi:hypothetical protein